MSEWISVKDKLPEYGLLVLTYGKIEGYRLITAGSINTAGNGLPCGVSHWMNVPEPPEDM